VALAVEAALDRADADDLVAGAQQVRPVRRAGEPHLHDQLRADEGARAPREVLADTWRAHADPADPDVERAVGERSRAEHAA
jgi:hypothetical protein